MGKESSASEESETFGFLEVVCAADSGISDKLRERPKVIFLKALPGARALVAAASVCVWLAGSVREAVVCQQSLARGSVRVPLIHGFLADSVTCGVKFLIGPRPYLGVFIGATLRTACFHIGA